MQQIWLMVIFVLHCLGVNGTLGIELTCQPQPTCSECLRSPGCAWCKQKEFLKQGESNERRCDLAESLKSRKCDAIVDPEQQKDVRKNRPLGSNAEEVIQLTPQSISLKLRIGQPQEFNVSVKRAVGYPIDLYYLMDLSFSMKDDLEKIKNLGQDILTTLEKFTKDRYIGFGSFVDKVALPYVSQKRSRRANPCPSRLDQCQPAFSFRNILPLTDKAAKFKEEVSKQKISGNLDSPEAGLDAIMQSVVCRKDIGWRNVTSILVYTSDDTFHMAGDGHLAGIYRPHDGKCHLDSTSTYEGTLQDYPSIGHLSTVLQSNNMQLIFAVTEEIYPAYESLSALIPRSVVGVLKNDSSNVVQLISEAYGNLSASIVLEHEHAPEGMSISYRSLCEGDHWRSRGECSGVKLGQQVDFTIRINATACLAEKAPVKIKVQGISDVLSVYVETICDCDYELCGARKEKSPECSGNGTFHCGICSCDGNYRGLKCDCQMTNVADSSNAVDAPCRQTNTSDVCESHGHCECGKCVCLSHYHGDFCECDDRNCPKVNKDVCNNRGTCNCDKCVCEGGFSGETCQCPPVDQRDCGGEDGQICSGQGKCPCDRCVCNTGLSGQYCDRVIEPCGPKYQNCTLCAALGKYPGGEECKRACAGLFPVRMEEQQEYHCTHEGFTFFVSVTNGEIHVHYAELPKSIDKTSVIIGSSVTGIVVIGIIIIIVYRLLVELYDLREYRSFLLAQEMSVWKNTDNPLFQGATTTVMNPLHDDAE